MENHFSIHKNTFTSDAVYHASNGVTQLFGIEISQGRDIGLLEEPYKAIVSETFAQKHFGTENPIGQIIHQFPAHQFQIEAVYKDLPTTTHFTADILLSFHSNMHLPPPLKDNWGEFGFYTYLKLSPSANLPKLEEAMAEHSRQSNSNLQKSNIDIKYYLQPLKDIRTKSHLKNEITQNIRGDYLVTLQLISILILIGSCFNYVYFSHTQLTNKSIQLGIKKANGANNLSLLKQLTTESFIIHCASMFLSILAFSIINESSSLMSGHMPINHLGTTFWVSLFSIFTLSGLLNPFILWLMIYKKQPITLLNPLRNVTHNTFSYRQLLTVIQFTMIVFLISVIIGIHKQVNYLKNKEKGFKLTEKLVIKTPAYLRRNSGRINNLNAFEQELEKLPGIEKVAISSHVPGDIPTFNYDVTKSKSGDGIKIAMLIANSDFIETFDIKTIAGTKLNNDVNNEGCVINASCLKQLGYKQPHEAIGEKLILKSKGPMPPVETSVKGVCNDFHFTSVKEAPGPIVLLDLTQNMLWGRYTLSINPHTDKKGLITSIEKLFRTTFPNYSYDYFWVEDHYNKQFQEENSITTILKRFALIAILLGMLSLFSMVWQASLARTKEIAIRKVNGATKANIINLLSIDFLKWIVLASLIAIPLGWYFLSSWLEAFTYKTSLSPWIFMAAAGCALFIGMITVSWQSYKVANMNPVHSLKYE